MIEDRAHDGKEGMVTEVALCCEEKCMRLFSTSQKTRKERQDGKEEWACSLEIHFI